MKSSTRIGKSCGKIVRVKQHWLERNSQFLCWPRCRCKGARASARKWEEDRVIVLSSSLFFSRISNGFHPRCIRVLLAEYCQRLSSFHFIFIMILLSTHEYGLLNWVRVKPLWMCACSCMCVRAPAVTLIEVKRAQMAHRIPTRCSHSSVLPVRVTHKSEPRDGGALCARQAKSETVKIHTHIFHSSSYTRFSIRYLSAMLSLLITRACGLWMSTLWEKKEKDGSSVFWFWCVHWIETWSTYYKIVIPCHCDLSSLYN